jgi:pSer/pThr/pTyr-binding forkhead associated (FHA) protein
MSDREVSFEEVQRKAFLVIKDQFFPLNKKIINIGRRLTNHLVIDDSRISRVHAQLRNIKGRFFIVDLNSTGGTYVNSKRIEQAMLYSGDIISLAGYLLEFIQEDSSMLASSEEYTTPTENKKKQGKTTSPIASDSPDQEE